MTTRPASPFTIVAAVSLLASTAPAQAPDAMRVAEIATYVGADTYGATPGIEHRDFWRRVGQSRLYRSEIRSAEQITELFFHRIPNFLEKPSLIIRGLTHEDEITDEVRLRKVHAC